MNLFIKPTKKLEGEIVAPGSKSYSHRTFIAASLANGISIIKNALTEGDVGITINILKKLNVKIIKRNDNSYIVERTKNSFKTTAKPLNCGNSGTSIRIFSALSLIVKDGLIFEGEFIKKNRPILPLLEALKKLGAEYKIEENKISIKRVGEICNKIKIRGDISSQFITALLFVAPLLKCDNTNQIIIELTTPLVSYPYIRITLDILKAFGINIYENLDEKKSGTYIIYCPQSYRPQVYEIPGDFSSAAFVIAATVLMEQDSKVIIKNLDYKNPQGDKEFIDILKKMGANIKILENQKAIEIIGNIKKFPLKGIEVDCNNIPDLFPILAVMGAYSKGKMVLYNAENLRRKESDRIAVMARELKKMGVKVEEGRDKLIIYHCDLLNISDEINHEQDHRIAMALTIAILASNSIYNIQNIEIVKDSYPSFIEDLKKLGANIEIN
ncbi:MAG: 3-phosphoshikimate 1-carboxyvinyltransferase [Promethearchaeota archaeon]